MARASSNSPELRVEIPAVRGTNPASDVGAISPSSTGDPSSASLLEEQFTCVGSRLAGEFNKGQGLVHRLTRIMHHMERFLHVWPTIAHRRSVRLDRREATRRATRFGLICLCRRLVG